MASPVLVGIYVVNETGRRGRAGAVRAYQAGWGGAVANSPCPTVRLGRLPGALCIPMAPFLPPMPVLSMWAGTWPWGCFCSASGTERVEH